MELRSVVTLHIHTYQWHSWKVKLYINFSFVRRNTKSKQKITFPCFIISSPLRNWYQPILAYSHPGGNKRLNTYITKCHALSAHQTKTQYCILDTDGRHVYTVTANQNIGGMIWMVMFDFQTDTVMSKHQNAGLEGFNTRCEPNALHVVWNDNVFHLKKKAHIMQTMSCKDHYFQVSVYWRICNTGFLASQLQMFIILKELIFKITSLMMHCLPWKAKCSSSGQVINFLWNLMVASLLTRLPLDLNGVSSV